MTALSTARVPHSSRSSKFAGVGSGGRVGLVSGAASVVGGRTGSVFGSSDGSGRVVVGSMVDVVSTTTSASAFASIRGRLTWFWITAPAGMVTASTAAPMPPKSRERFIELSFRVGNDLPESDNARRKGRFHLPRESNGSIHSCSKFGTDPSSRYRVARDGFPGQKAPQAHAQEEAQEDASQDALPTPRSRQVS